MTLVMKFGGTSVQDAERLRRVASIVTRASGAGEAVLVVVSAMGKTTDGLFAAAREAESGRLDAAFEGLKALSAHHAATIEALVSDGARREEVLDAVRSETTRVQTLLNGVALLRELSPRSLDAIVALGETATARILHGYLEAAGQACEHVDARSIVRTDASFGGAEPDRAAIRAGVRRDLEPRLTAGRIVVTQGYIGSSTEGLTTTLGRGGSDYSAALLGASLGASEIQIWTDVEGVLTADPRVAASARPIREMSFAEAAELAAFGAKVLHPATIQPAVEAGIPVTVRHTLRPEGAFTTIASRRGPARAVTALASRGPITIVTVASTRMLDQSGFLARMFDVFARHSVSVDVVATAEVSVSLTVDPQAPLDAIRRDLSAFAEVDVRENRALVAVVGESLRDTKGQAARVFGAVKDINVEMISMGANEINLSLVVKREDEAACVRALHRELFETAAEAAA